MSPPLKPPSSALIRGLVTAAREVNLGPLVRDVLDLVRRHPDGARLLARFELATNAAIYRNCLERPSPALMRAADRRLVALKKYVDGAAHLSPQQKDAVLRQIQQRWRPMYYGPTALAEAREVAALAAAKWTRRQASPQEIARYGQALRSYLVLAGHNKDATAQLASALARRFTSMGPRVEGVFDRLAEYLATHAKQIADEIARIDATRKSMQQMGAAAKRKAQGQLDRNMPFYYGIRGLLGEIYLFAWRFWLRRRNRLLREARGIARRLKGDWAAVHLTEDEIRLGVSEEYGWLKTVDECIVVLNRTTGQAWIHMGANIKITKRPNSLVSQFFSQRRRELVPRGGGTDAAAGTAIAPKPNILRIKEGDEWKEYVLGAPPPGVSTKYFGFHNQGPKITAGAERSLENRMLQIKITELDLPAGPFEALAEALMRLVARIFNAGGG